MLTTRLQLQKPEALEGFVGRWAVPGAGCVELVAASVSRRGTSVVDTIAIDKKSQPKGALERLQNAILEHASGVEERAQKRLYVVYAFGVGHRGLAEHPVQLAAIGGASFAELGFGESDELGAAAMPDAALKAGFRYSENLGKAHVGGLSKLLDQATNVFAQLLKSAMERIAELEAENSELRKHHLAHVKLTEKLQNKSLERELATRDALFWEDKKDKGFALLERAAKLGYARITGSGPLHQLVSSLNEEQRREIFSWLTPGQQQQLADVLKVHQEAEEAALAIVKQASPGAPGDASPAAGGDGSNGSNGAGP